MCLKNYFCNLCETYHALQGTSHRKSFFKYALKWNLKPETHLAGMREGGDTMEKIHTVFTDETQDSLYRIEKDSWWFSYRAEIITDRMERFFCKETLTADIGGGNGYTTAIAAGKGFQMLLVEPSVRACENAAKRGLKTECAMVTEKSPKAGIFGQALLLDVLEHIEDDRKFLSLISQKLPGGGILLITVPAFGCLWSSEDEAAGHYRRYRISELSGLMKDCGFRILYQSYFMSFLFLPVLIFRAGLERTGILKKQWQRTEEEKEKITKTQFQVKNKIVKRVLYSIEKLERRALEKLGKVPFGSSIIVVGKKL